MKKWNNEFTRFVLVGGLNTTNYYLFYVLFYNLLDWFYLLSHISAFFISMVISFFLNVYFTYRVKPTIPKFLMFPFTQVVNMSVSSLLVFIFVDLFGWNGNVAPLVAVFFTVPITFIVTGKILKR
ncbi:GtrA family protein [Salimicrobium flavidum]|uniref:Putative flippase GtrA (Transmembrane translocase of bactoprenol-linked glucose) n=1 Tax=Salimicrobium flavidum TaxID=570947 RepID=A0A1N7J8W2_9BACI|nr:GtrA family protein [Salimicrobium flavidum]SIS45808.1 Putative flippase GtrA (transmembrane translocase of bactoprenol-linked glucose) [Salimicrobium flavidum]